ncbi:MAG: hypothetical protein AB1830_14940 [Pseudomonadota bacterium]
MSAENFFKYRSGNFVLPDELTFLQARAEAAKLGFDPHILDLPQGADPQMVTAYMKQRTELRRFVNAFMEELRKEEEKKNSQRLDQMTKAMGGVPSAVEG